MAMMLQPNGRVIAFEPFPVNYDRLVKNIRLNNGAVEPVLCALGEVTETRSIRFKEQGGGSKRSIMGGCGFRLNPWTATEPPDLPTG